MVKQPPESILTPTYNIYFIWLHISKFMTYMNVIFINGLPVRLRRQWKLFSTHRRSSMAMVNQVNYCRCLVGCCVCSWSSIPTIISNHVISIPFWYEAWILCPNLMFSPLILLANASTEFSLPSLRSNELFRVIYIKLRVRRTSMVIDIKIRS